MLTSLEARSTRLARLVLTPLLCVAGAVSAVAQQAPAASIQLPPVTVTAQKEPADPRKVPVSVTAVPATTLLDAGVGIVSDAAMYSPNTFFTEFSARKLSNARVRGVGSSPANPGVTTYFDGVPQLNANSSSVDLLDVEQVEFVRGPQSALFGRNALGGLVNVTSRRPSLDKWSGSFSAPFANASYKEVRASRRRARRERQGRGGLRAVVGATGRLYDEQHHGQHARRPRGVLGEGAAAVHPGGELGDAPHPERRAGARRRLRPAGRGRAAPGPVRGGARLRGLHAS